MKDEVRKEIEDLAELMFSAGTPEERKKADERFAKLNETLTPEEKREGGKIIREVLAARRAVRRAKRTDINMKEKLAGIQDMISLSYIARQYFGRNRSWLYQRINGTTVNGKPAAFTEEELKVFSDALRDIGSKISESSLLIN